MEYISLYDFLGRAAGADLGRAVGLQAYRENIDVVRRTIVTATYQGEVNLYPKEFLKRIITNKTTNANNVNQSKSRFCKK
jgi:hypothetical protein